MHKPRDMVYFPGLDGLRFIAAFSVVIHHIEQRKREFGWVSPSGDETFWLARLLPTGTAGVILFFVLSGFLITYLLLVEHERTGTVQIKKFYVRRALRIWPLYYLLVLIGFVILPLIVQITHLGGHYLAPDPADFPLNLLLYLFLMPNIALKIQIFITGITHLWTIGIEEQFYLLWPLLMKRFAKYVLACLLAVIAIKLAWIGLNMLFQAELMPPGLDGLRLLTAFVVNFRIESMAVGGLGAYLVFYHKDRILSVIFHPVIEKIILVLTVVIAVLLYYPHILGEFFFAVLCILLILNVTCNPRSIVKLENRRFRQLGKYSYGIYMYHLLVMQLTFMVCHGLGWTNGHDLWFNLALYTFITLSTIGLAALSYEWFEKRFLRLKSRWQVVKSGEPAPLAAPNPPQLIPTQPSGTAE